MNRTCLLLSIVVWLLAAPFAAQPHALNPDSIDRYVEATLTPTQIVLVYQLILGLNPTEDASRRLDPNDDGEITDEERDRYLQSEGRRYGGRQYIKVGDEVLMPEYRMGDAYSYIGHNGINVIKVDFGYVCPLPASLPRGATLDFQLKDYDLETVPGWKQMQVISTEGAHFEGHIPYTEYKPFDYEILNTKGFAPATDSINGQVSFDKPTEASPVDIVLPEKPGPEIIRDNTWQYWVFGGVAIVAATFIAAFVMKMRR
ncbi:hypothetical protein K8I31_00220 [bacterium]|nr:hypothetical protein [bacterium]